MRQPITRSSAQKKFAAGPEHKTKVIKKAQNTEEVKPKVPAVDHGVRTRSGIKASPSKASKVFNNKQKGSPTSKKTTSPNQEQEGLKQRQEDCRVKTKGVEAPASDLMQDNESQQSTSFDSDALNRINSMPTLTSEIKSLSKMLSVETDLNGSAADVSSRGPSTNQKNSLISNKSD